MPLSRCTGCAQLLLKDEVAAAVCTSCAPIKELIPSLFPAAR